MSILSGLSRNRSLLIRVVVVPAAAIFVLIHMYRGNGYSDTGAFACAAMAVLLADLASLARGAVRNLLVVLASLVFGLGVLDGIANAMLPKLDFVDAKGVWGDRPVLGWGPTAPGTFSSAEYKNGKPVYKVTYTFDDDLLRLTKATKDGPTIAFFGDSFTFGSGINDVDTLPQSFADIAPGFNVINLAYQAYSPAQVLREMQVGLFDKRLESPRLFVLQTAPWHAERTSCRRAFVTKGPHYRLVDGKLEFAGPCATGEWQRFADAFRSLAFYRFFLEPIFARPSHADLETYIDIVNAITKLAHDKYRVPFVILYAFPQPRYLAGTGYTNQRIEADFRAAGAHLIDTNVDGKPGDVLEIPDNGHPTGTANRLLARKLLDDLKATMPEVLKRSETTPQAARQ